MAEGAYSVAVVMIIGATMIAKAGVGGVAGFGQDPRRSLSATYSGRRTSLAT
jgi:hypothetical protein